MKYFLELLDHPRLPEVAIAALLLIMALLTPRLMPGWIDEFWIVNYGQNVFGHTAIAPQHTLHWGGAWLSALFHEWLPGMFGQRWLSWLSTVGMTLAALRLGRLMKFDRTTAAWLVVLLLLSPEVRFEGQNGRVDNLAMMWVFLALGQTHLALTSSSRQAWQAGALCAIAVWTWITAVVPLLAILPLLVLHRDKITWQIFTRFVGGGLLTGLITIAIAPQNAAEGLDVLLDQLQWRWEEGAAHAAASAPPDWWSYRVTLMLGAAITILPGVLFLRFKLKRHHVLWGLQVTLAAFALWLTVRTHLYHARIVYWMYLVVSVGFIVMSTLELHSVHGREMRSRVLAAVALLFGIWQAPGMFFSMRHALRKPPLEIALRERIAHLDVGPGQVVATFSREYAPFVEEVGATPVLGGAEVWQRANLVIASRFGPSDDEIVAAGFERLAWPERFEEGARFQRLPAVFKPVSQ